MAKFKENLFVTGGSGFIGKNIVEYFKKEYKIIAPTHKELDLMSQKQVKTFFEENDVNYVIHCANVGGSRKTDNISNVVEKNLRMFFNLSENRKYFDKMICLGSGAAYDKETMSPNVNEIDIGVTIPKDEYGFSKYVISKYIENTQENIYCLNLFGIFGPHEDYEFKFISNSIVKNLLHLPITVMQNVFFDWLYIEDFLRVLDYFLKNDPSHKNYNVCTGYTVDLISIANLICEISDFKSDIIIKNEGLNREYSGNNSRLINELDIYSFLDMKTAINRLYNYYKLNLSNIDHESIKNDVYINKCKIKNDL